MKRDMDLIREILIKIEEHEDGRAPNVIVVDGYTEDQIYHHIYLMGQANLLEVSDYTTIDSKSPVAMPYSMTWKGHDFLDAIRSDKIWEKTKRKIKEAGGSMPYKIVKTIAIAIIKKQVGL